MNRRKTLQFMGASVLGGAALSQTVLAQNGSTTGKSGTSDSGNMILQPDNPEHLHLMHKKLAYTTDDRLVYWYINALRMGYKDGILTPFWNMHVGMIYKVVPLEAFRYEVKTILKIFYTDIKTGKLLETFDNPYTGEKREVSQPKKVKVDRIFGLNGVEHDGPLSQPQTDEKGATYRNDEIGPASIIGDDIWMQSDSIFLSETPNGLDRKIRVNDWSTFHGSYSEVCDPSVTSAAATHTFNDLNTFNHNWVGMQGVEARSISRGYGRKSWSVDGMPSEWKELVAKTNPELLELNPGF